MSKFVPQAINYDTLGGVTYNKGCYPGQEVISRVHNNMAKFGKTMVFAKTEGDVPPRALTLRLRRSSESSSSP